MKAALLISFLIMSAHARAETNEFWKTDFESALQTAKANSNPIVVQFHASWCGPCRVMKQTTLKDQSVIDALSNYVRVSVDFDKNPELVKQYGIQGIPAFVVVSPAGDEVAKTVGLMNAQNFRDWLMTGLATAAFTEAQQKVFAEKRALIEQKLKAIDKDQRDWAVTAVLDYCSSPEKSYRVFAQEKLKAFAEEHPHQLIDALNHPHLATRIHIANLLHNKVPNFTFDPWETTPNRSKLVEQLKAAAVSPAN